MPRRKRVKAAGFVRHVTSRGNGRMAIFLDEGHFRTFLGLLNDTVQRFNVECWDFCVMSNHFHLALRNREENLSEAIQYLNGEYARWWNYVHQHAGHVFQGPFKDQIVQEDSYAMSLFRYIARNPVRAGLVQQPEDWPWSAYRCIAGLCAPPDFLSCDHVLRQFGDDEDVRALRDRYIRHVLSATPHEEMRAQTFRAPQRIVGDRNFTGLMSGPRKPAVEPRDFSALAMPGFI